MSGKQDIVEGVDAIVTETTEGEIITGAEKEVAKRFAQGSNDKYGRFFLAALSAIPWVIPLSLIASLKGEMDQDGLNSSFRLWLQEHQEKLKEVVQTINEILTRLDSFGAEVQQRIESPEYLNLVRRAFRTWDEADTQEKRLMLKQLLTNAGAITLCPDDQVRLFIDWIERYHEAHFAVIKEVYLHQPITKGRIWDNLHSEGRPRDNTAQAGLFGYLTRELNMGGIIHLNRQTNAYGQTMRSPRQSSSGSNRSDTLESHFDDTKEWVLSELGKEFVRYVMKDVDLQLQDAPN
ncbi:MAG TPA: hypothetical protein VLB02_02050 [Candidatus Paceibacterota bacterium]|nr:hypothetical protein [Candidatus Paceibacterota bacterium]